MRNSILVFLALWQITGISFAQEVRETTTALGWTGVKRVGPGSDIQVLRIGVTSSDTAFVEGIRITLFDLADPTGLEVTDFSEIRLYRELHSGLIPYYGIGKLTLEFIQLGQPLFIKATEADTLFMGVEQFYTVSILMSPGAVVDHTFKISFPKDGFLTTFGGIGTAVVAEDSNRAQIVPVIRTNWPSPSLPVYVILPNGHTPFLVDFEDFIAFVQSFGSLLGEDRFNPLADTNDDGVISFPDFINFAGSFGMAAVGPAN